MAAASNPDSSEVSSDDEPSAETATQNFYHNVICRQLDILKCDFDRNTKLRTRITSDMCPDNQILIEIDIADDGSVGTRHMEIYHLFAVDPQHPVQYHCDVKKQLVDIYVLCVRLYPKPNTVQPAVQKVNLHHDHGQQ
jgi:hypothetical protein